MILAGDGHTNIIRQDSLENQKKDEFDIVLTNFPFSQSTDYAYLYGLSNRQANPIFLKHVIDSLKKAAAPVWLFLMASFSQKTRIIWR